MFFLFRLETTTLHPAYPSSVTMALPIPVEEAVTTATLPLSDDMIIKQIVGIIFHSQYNVY